MCAARIAAWNDQQIETVLPIDKGSCLHLVALRVCDDHGVCMCRLAIIDGVREDICIPHPNVHEDKSEDCHRTHAQDDPERGGYTTALDKVNEVRAFPALHLPVGQRDQFSARLRLQSTAPATCGWCSFLIGIGDGLDAPTLR